MSLSCEETVNLIRSYGCLLSLTVVTVQKPAITDSSAYTEIHTCELNSIPVLFIVCLFLICLTYMQCITIKNFVSYVQCILHYLLSILY